MFYARRCQISEVVLSGTELVTPLTVIERQVVRLSPNDAKNTIAKPSRARRICQGLLGAQPANPLADPRLEALRAFCVKYRISRDLPCHDSTDRLLPFETMLAAVELISGHGI